LKPFGEAAILYLFLRKGRRQESETRKGGFLGEGGEGMGEITEDMSRLWERFNLMEEEDEEVVAPEIEVEPMVNRGSACVVGKLLADRSVGKEVIKTPLMRAWQPTKGVTFKNLRN
jgi:hypothetical protein